MPAAAQVQESTLYEYTVERLIGAHVKVATPTGEIYLGVNTGQSAFTKEDLSGFIQWLVGINARLQQVTRHDD